MNSRQTTALLLVTVCLLSLAAPVNAEDPIAIGSRLEPFVDDHLIAEFKNSELQLHRPVPREVSIVHDKPWEGNVCCYHTVFQDGDIFRMYYRGANYDETARKSTHPELYCYAESRDGIHWTKPELGIYDFRGSKKNNIVHMGAGSHNFAPFRDENPDCAPEAKYKAIATGKGGLIAFQSPDAIHWKLIRKVPVITEGAFDSQNLAFWDTVRERYVDFHRDFRNGTRDIKTCFSQNFLDWTDPDWIEYPGVPAEHLYTNAVTPLPRAPHVFVGFPKRLVIGRNPAKHRYPGCSDGVFMTSRDGQTWKRWREALVRPGQQIERWVNRNNMTAWGVLVTNSGLPGTPPELSIYSTENYYRGSGVRLRRYASRLDGFVSVNAKATGGEFVTRPISFEIAEKSDGARVQNALLGGATRDGRLPVSGSVRGEVELLINYATSAAGSLRCEIQDADGNPIPGYSLAEADEIYGDEIERAVSWSGYSEVKPLMGKPIRLRFVMSDADLYSIRFR